MQKLLARCLQPVSLFLLTLIFCTTVSSISAAAHSDSVARAQGIYISLHLQNASLSQALQVIGEESGFGITYTDTDLPTVTINYDHPRISVADALSQVLKGTKLAYREFQHNIIIYVRPPVQQTSKGAIKGSLADEETGELLIGASVRVVGTSFGNITDVSGQYVIKGIPEGMYELAISYLGYETAIMRNVKVTGGETTTIDHKLKASGTRLQDIEIIGDRVLSGNVVETNESALMKEIKSSPLIITGISAQQISRSVDQDAGEVARRLPGVSLLNNFVNIRGMHERYNITYLNGMVAPSSESDRRAFSYDLLPSNMIDKMTVFRSPGPELLADWAGGAIKIETKNTSIARQFEVSLSTWYRPNSSFEDYYTNNGGKKDWLGKDDGTRALPKGFPVLGAIPAGGIGNPAYDRPDPNGYKGVVMSPENLAANAAWAKKLYNQWNVQDARSGLDYRAGINYYDAWKIGKVRLSNLTSINTTQAVQLINQDFIPQRLIASDGTVSDTKSFRDTVSRETARWGLLQNLTLGISPGHIIELKGLYNRLGINETLIREGHENTSDFGGYVRNIIYTYRSRSIGVGQVAGNHTLGKMSDHVLKWSAGYSRSIENIPAQRSFYNPKPPFEYPLAIDRGSTNNALYYIDTDEHNMTYTFDYEKKFGQSVFVRAGGFHEDKKKDMDTRMINLKGDPEDTWVIEGDSIDERNYGKIFRPEVFKEDGSGGYIFDNEYLSGQYAIRGKIYAGYVAVNLPFFNKRLNVYGGVRYEGQDVHLTIPATRYLELTGHTPDLIDKYVFYWLPSVNASWNFTEKILARAAYGKTINRPNYREYMPFELLDPRLDNITIGNDSLTDAEIHNLDLRLEYYPEDGEFISAGVFYKKLTNAIEPYTEWMGKRENIKFDNTDKAIVYGVEVEVRKNLGFIPVRWARRFSTIANVAWLHSKVEFTDGLIPAEEGNFENNAVTVRPLEGTAKYVINAGLYYDQEEWGTKVSVLYNITGQRLVYAPTRFWPATYEMPRHIIDLTLRQRINKLMEFRIAVQDILNQPRRLYRDYDRDQVYDPDKRNKLRYKDWMFQEYKPGSYYMVGVNFTF